MVNGLWSFFGQMHGGLKGHAVSSTVDQVELVEADPDAVALLTRLPNISLDSKERLRSGTGRGLGGLWSLRNGCSFLRMPDLVVKPRHEDDARIQAFMSSFCVPGSFFSIQFELKHLFNVGTATD